MTTAEEDTLSCDVLIIGAGPAGLSAAIRLKQLSAASGQACHVILLEKAAEIGGHILSGAVLDPRGLDHLFPHWRKQEDVPVKTSVSQDDFFFLGPGGSARVPGFLRPALMHNTGHYIISLGHVCRWLAQKAEALGVEIYTGFAAADFVHDNQGRVIGIETGSLGLDRSGKKKETYVAGMRLLAKYVFLAEGARGSLSQKAIARYHLAKDTAPQKYGIGLKELWRVPKQTHVPGRVQHTLGWPLDNGTGGGGFVYHFEEDLVSLGLVVHLNYPNPYLSPFQEFQRFKTHPLIKGQLEGGQRLAYGARCLTEGGWQSVPKLAFPGGVLIGCAAGFVNVPRIKGIHNAMDSGILAAESAMEALGQNRAHDLLESYAGRWQDSAIGADLYPVRNVKPLWSRFGTLLGGVLSGLDLWTQSLFKKSFFGTLSHKQADYRTTRPAKGCHPIIYPKPDNIYTFDCPSSVYLSGVFHDHDQPVHLKLVDAALQRNSEYALYAGLSQRYCPAGVYEWQKKETGKPIYVINAQNCIHCKACDIKDPNQNIVWTPPEGGGGPNYMNM